MPDPRLGLRRQVQALALAIVLVTMGICGVFVSHALSVRSLKGLHARNLDALHTQHHTRLSTLDETHEAALADVELISGKRAQTAHAMEWRRRLDHEPDFARTPRERAILEMVRLSGSTDLSADAVLQEVARLASPRGSEVHVRRTPNGHVLSVSFDMSSLTSGEQGSRTKHHTKAQLRREVEDLTARVFKDVFFHCGRREIAAVAVGCKHGVVMRGQAPPDKAAHRARDELPLFWQVEADLATRDGEVKDIVLFMSEITHSTASTIHDWRTIKTYELAERWHVVQDEFPHIEIESDDPLSRFRGRRLP